MTSLPLSVTTTPMMMGSGSITTMSMSLERVFIHILTRFRDRELVRAAPRCWRDSNGSLRSSHLVGCQNVSASGLDLLFFLSG